MNRAIIILLGAAMLFYAGRRARGGSKSKWLRQLSGSQKIFGAAAFLLALIILMNPEVLALGFVGDTAFFDMLVLALSLQLHTYTFRAARGTILMLKRTLRWPGIPSFGLRYLVKIWAPPINNTVRAIQKTAHHFGKWPGALA